MLTENVVVGLASNELVRLGDGDPDGLGLSELCGKHVLEMVSEAVDAEIAGVVVGKSEMDTVSVGSADTRLALDDRGMLVVLEVSHAKETNSVCVSVIVDQTVTLSVAVWVSVSTIVSVRVEVVVDTGGS